MCLFVGNDGEGGFECVGVEAAKFVGDFTEVSEGGEALVVSGSEEGFNFGAFGGGFNNNQDAFFVCVIHVFFCFVLFCFVWLIGWLVGWLVGLLVGCVFCGYFFSFFITPLSDPVVLR